MSPVVLTLNVTHGSSQTLHRDSWIPEDTPAVTLLRDIRGDTKLHTRCSASGWPAPVPGGRGPSPSGRAAPTWSLTLVSCCGS